MTGTEKVVIVEEVKPEQEGLLLTLEKGQKPWYLTTTEIYKIVKGTVKFIPRSEELFERSLQAIELVAKYVNESTRVKIAFDPEQTYDLIHRLDDVLTEQLVSVDDGFDSLRSKFCSSLRSLITALKHHKDWAEHYAKTQQENAKQAVAVRYEHAILFVKLLLQYAEQRFPKASKLVVDSVDRVKATVNQSKEIYHGKVPDSIHEYAAKILADAQPYVHQTVKFVRPTMERAIDISQPYLERSKPYIDPIAQKAEGIETSLKENAYVGSYVTKAIDTSYELFNQILLYAIPPTEPSEEVPVVAVVEPASVTN